MKLLFMGLYLEKCMIKATKELKMALNSWFGSSLKNRLDFPNQKSILNKFKFAQPIHNNKASFKSTSLSASQNITHNPYKSKMKLKLHFRLKDSKTRRRTSQRTLEKQSLLLLSSISMTFDIYRNSRKYSFRISKRSWSQKGSRSRQYQVSKACG